MGDVKWIKIATDIFDNRKIRMIESMPDGDAIIVIWVKLLCLAGNINDKGFIYLTQEIPYTDQMLSVQFGKPLSTVQLALKTFKEFGMIEIVDDMLHISSWEKYQNVDGMEKIREQTRKRVADYRERKALEMESLQCSYCGDNATGYDHIIPVSRGGKDVDSNKVPCCIRCNRIKNDKPLVDFLNNNRSIIRDDLIAKNDKFSHFVTLRNATDRYEVTQCNALDIELERELDKDKELDKEREKEKTLIVSNDTICQTDVRQVIEKWNELQSFGITPVSKMSPDSKRYKSLVARIRQFGIDDVCKAIDNIKDSPWLLGQNKDGWMITLDWFVCPTNFQKVFDGNYIKKVAKPERDILNEWRNA